MSQEQLEKHAKAIETLAYKIQTAITEYFDEIGMSMPAAPGIPKTFHFNLDDTKAALSVLGTFLMFWHTRVGLILVDEGFDPNAIADDMDAAIAWGMDKGEASAIEAHEEQRRISKKEKATPN